VAAYNFDDCTLVYNSQTLTSFVMEISGVKINAILQDFHPMGVAWPTPIDTGLRNHDDIQIKFLYDGGGAATPPTACAVGTSATMTLTLATGQTVSGTFIVADAEAGLGTEGSHTWTATFRASGTITYDVAA
jgi:hypothetical protein